MVNGFNGQGMHAKGSVTKDVPLDYFLYSCLDAEKAVAANNNQQTIQWPTLQDLSEDDLQEEINAHQLIDLFEDMMSWYAANYPDMSQSDVWDYEIVNRIAPALVAMAKDFAVIYQHKVGQDLPSINPQLDRQEEPWPLIEQLVERFFPRKSSWIMRYLYWTYGTQKDDDLGSRPPVGRYAQQARRQQNRYNGKTRSNSGGRSDRRPNRKDLHSNKRQQGRFNKKPRGGQQGPDPEKQKAVLKDCEEAIEFLKNNAEEQRFVLRPQNSFYRRIQHQYVCDQGFTSESIGEGQQRAVVVKRKDSGVEDDDL